MRRLGARWSFHTISGRPTSRLVMPPGALPPVDIGLPYEIHFPSAASSHPRARRLSWSPPTWLRTSMRTAMARPAAKRIQTARAAAAGESRHGLEEDIGAERGEVRTIYFAARAAANDGGFAAPAMAARPAMDGGRRPVYRADPRLLLAPAAAVERSPRPRPRGSAIQPLCAQVG